MRATLNMINAVRGVVPATVEECRTVVEAVLRDVPDVEPFTFPGFPDSEVYIHSVCGTVVDTVPGSDMDQAVKAGLCDCENAGSWMRIYVERGSEK